MPKITKEESGKSDSSFTLGTNPFIHLLSIHRVFIPALISVF